MINKTNKLNFLLGCLVFFSSSYSNAGCIFPPTVPPIFTSGTPSTNASGHENVNRGYAGLKWTFGEGPVPSAVIGFRHANVEPSGHVDGGDVSMSFNFLNGPHPGKLRAKYFNGQENVQGEIGGGFDFTKGMFAGASLQGPYINLGADYLFGAGFEPYVILNNLRKYHKPQPGFPGTAGSYACPAAFPTKTTPSPFPGSPFGCR